MPQNVLIALVGAVGMILSALGGAWFTARGKHSPSETQDTINVGFEALMKAQTKRIDDLERRLEIDNKECDEQLETLRGQIRNLRQFIESLIALLRRHGISIPRKEYHGFLLTDLTHLEKPDDK